MNAFDRSRRHIEERGRTWNVGTPDQHPDHAARLAAHERSARAAGAQGDLRFCRRIFGCVVSFWPVETSASANLLYYWRCKQWPKERDKIGPFPTRQAAIRDAAQRLYQLPDWRGRRLCSMGRPVGRADRKDGAA